MEKEILKGLRKYSKIFLKALEDGKKEADLVMYIVHFLSDVLGYDVFSEISKEYQIKERYCDLAIKIKGNVELLIEVKQPGMPLADRHIDQAENYAIKSGTRWVVLTNGIEWRLYHLTFSEYEGIQRTLAFRTDFAKTFSEHPSDVTIKFMMLHKRYLLKGDLDKYWQKKLLLIPQSLSRALFSEDVLRKIATEVNRGAQVRVGIEDVSKSLKKMLDKEVLADLADIKIIKKRKPSKPRPKVLKEDENLAE